MSVKTYFNEHKEVILKKGGRKMLITDLMKTKNKSTTEANDKSAAALLIVVESLHKDKLISDQKFLDVTDVLWSTL